MKKNGIYLALVVCFAGCASTSSPDQILADGELIGKGTFRYNMYDYHEKIVSGDFFVKCEKPEPYAWLTRKEYKNNSQDYFLVSGDEDKFECREDGIKHLTATLKMRCLYDEFGCLHDYHDYLILAD